MKKLRVHDDDGYTREYLVPDDARVTINTAIPAQVTAYRKEDVGSIDTTTTDDSLRGTWGITRPKTVVGIDLAPVRIWKSGSSQVEPW